MTVAIARAGSGTRAVGLVTIASGALAAVGLVFLGGMFAAFAAGAQGLGQGLGWINDVLGLVSCALAAPAVLAVGDRLRPTHPRLAAGGTVIALASIAGVVGLQGLLVTGRLSFQQQVGPVSAAYLGLGAWFVAVGWAGRRTRVLSVGPWTGLAAALYVGYPLWAIRLGRQLLGEARR
jgi:hypothetical protein